MSGRPAFLTAEGPLVFVADLRLPELAPDDHHHLIRSRRLRQGGDVVAGDGQGSWRQCRLGPSSLLEPVDEIYGVVGPVMLLTVGFAPLKGSRSELVVQKLTELGIDRIVPLLTERGVVRWSPDRVERHVIKWQKVAREAAMQSRRVWLPEVGEPVQCIDMARANGARRADMGGDPLGPDIHTVLVGPEGGWADSERAIGSPVGIGQNVLRAETAAIAVGSIMTAIRAGLVDPAHTE